MNTFKIPEIKENEENWRNQTDKSNDSSKPVSSFLNTKDQKNSMQVIRIITLYSLINNRSRGICCISNEVINTKVERRAVKQEQNSDYTQTVNHNWVLQRN